MKIKSILFIVLVFFCFNVKAASDSCEQSELARLRELARKVEFDYDYKLVDGKAVFMIKAINLNSDLKVMIIDDYYSGKYKEFVDNNSHSATLDNFSSGERVVITINAFVPNRCSGNTLLRTTVKLPYYNYYYSEEKCNGNEDFKYCKLLINDNISEGEFEKQLFSFVKEKESKEVKPVEENDNRYIYIIIGVVFLIVAILAIVLIIRNVSRIRKKNSL